MAIEPTLREEFESVSPEYDRDTRLLQVEDDSTVESLFHEKLYRLLTVPVINFWK